MQANSLPSKTVLSNNCCGSRKQCFSGTLVGLDGLEPSTSRLSGARSNHLSYRPLFLRWSLVLVHLSDYVAGGDEGNRTLDPLLAGQVLSQLSYTPIRVAGMIFRPPALCLLVAFEVVVLARFYLASSSALKINPKYFPQVTS